MMTGYDWVNWAFFGRKKKTGLLLFLERGYTSKNLGKLEYQAIWKATKIIKTSLVSVLLSRSDPEILTTTHRSTSVFHLNHLVWVQIVELSFLWHFLGEGLGTGNTYRRPKNLRSKCYSSITSQFSICRFPRIIFLLCVLKWDQDKDLDASWLDSSHHSLVQISRWGSVSVPKNCPKKALIRKFWRKRNDMNGIQTWFGEPPRLPILPC